MLATSTHDTKRGEDCRARLAVLSEIAPDFAEAAARWRAMLGGSETGPDGNDIFLFFQLLVGAWPMELAPDDIGELERFQVRIQAAMLKSVREAKVHTNWAAPDETYEKSLHDYVAAAFADQDFLADFIAFETCVIELGAANSFMQTVLKFTAPGVPDIYQGAEAYDFSLVDPDNRRPVDWDWLTRRLEDIRPIARGDLLDGSAKLATIANLLGLRRRHGALFAAGDYRPIAMASDRFIAFSRQHGDNAFVVVAARFPGRGPIDGFLPLAQHCPVYRDVLSGRQITPGKEGIDLAMLLAELPAAVLVPQTPPAIRQSRP